MRSGILQTVFGLSFPPPLLPLVVAVALCGCGDGGSVAETSSASGGENQNAGGVGGKATSGAGGSLDAGGAGQGGDAGSGGSAAGVGAGAGVGGSSGLGTGGVGGSAGGGAGGSTGGVGGSGGAECTTPCAPATAAYGEVTLALPPELEPVLVLGEKLIRAVPSGAITIQTEGLSDRTVGWIRRDDATLVDVVPNEHISPREVRNVAVWKDEVFVRTAEGAWHISLSDLSNPTLTQLPQYLIPGPNGLVYEDNRQLWLWDPIHEDTTALAFVSDADLVLPPLLVTERSIWMTKHPPGNVLWRVPLLGGAPVETSVVSDGYFFSFLPPSSGAQPNPHAGSDACAEHIYFRNGPSQRVLYQQSFPGTQAELSADVARFATDENHVYWADGNRRLWKRAHCGGEPALLTELEFDVAALSAWNGEVWMRTMLKGIYRIAPL